VNANVGQKDLSLSTDASSLRIPMDQIGPTPPHYPTITGPRVPPPAIPTDWFGCLFNSDATMDLHNATRGLLYYNGDDSTGGVGASSIWQRTTAGVRPFGNAGSDAKVNGVAAAADKFVSTGQCLTQH
jgi:hypothetical protein